MASHVSEVTFVIMIHGQFVAGELYHISDVDVKYFRIGLAVLVLGASLINMVYFKSSDAGYSFTQALFALLIVLYILEQMLRNKGN